MDSNIWRFDYSSQKEFWFGLMSDLHIGHEQCDKKRIKKDLDKARELDAKVYINGDVMDLITMKDPRFHVAGNKYPTDNTVAAYIEEAYELLKPYSNIIDLIGVGNHEASLIRFHGFDPVYFLIQKLNLVRDTKKYGFIKAGGYTGFIRQMFGYGDSGSVRSYVIFYNHGQGASAEVSKGMIDLNRYRVSVIADLLWLGHKHKKILDVGQIQIQQRPNGKIEIKENWGIVTGAYLKPVYEKSSEKGYTLNYGEQKSRTLQSVGGVFLKQAIYGLKSEIKTTMLTERNNFQ